MFHFITDLHIKNIIKHLLDSLACSASGVKLALHDKPQTFCTFLMQKITFTFKNIHSKKKKVVIFYSPSSHIKNGFHRLK